MMKRRKMHNMVKDVGMFLLILDWLCNHIKHECDDEACSCWFLDSLSTYIYKAKLRPVYARIG